LQIFLSPTNFRFSATHYMKTLFHLYKFQGF